MPRRKKTLIRGIWLSPDGKRLIFQNLTGKVEGENAKQNFQIAVVETENSQTVKFFSLSGRQVGISWTADGKSFYYVLPKKDKDEIWHQSVDENIEPQLFKTTTKKRFRSAS